MRLSFPNGEHEDVLLPHGDTQVGSAAGSAVQLNTDGIAPMHAVFTMDRRGLILTVPSPQAIAHVNARRVKESALLRCGDLVSLGSINLTIKPDRDHDVSGFMPPPLSNNSSHSERALTPRVVLRGLAGNYFGKVIPIGDGLTVGRDAKNAVILDDPSIAPEHVRIDAPDGGIWLRSLAASDNVFVNGVAVKETILFSGDQLRFGQDRFLLEAPGTVTRASMPLPDDEMVIKPAPVNVTQSMRAIDVEITSVGAPATRNFDGLKQTPKITPEKPNNRDDEDKLTSLFLLLTGAAVAALLFWLLMR